MTTTEVLFSLDDVRVGDVVRVPGRPAWCVVVRVDAPDGGEVGPSLLLCPVASGALRRASGRVERMVDPGPWLRRQPTEALVVAAMALQVAEMGSEEEARARAAIERAGGARRA